MADEVVLPGTTPPPVLDGAPAKPAEQAAADAATQAAAAQAAAQAAAAEAAKQPIKFDTPDEKRPTPTPSTEQVVVYEKTGDPGLDVALQYVGQRGFGPDHPAMAAATKGDFTLLEAELAKLGEAKAPGAKAYVDLAKHSYERRQSAVAESAAATTKLVHETVGGAANWDAIKTWTQENADADEKRQLNAAFAAGGIVAAAAAERLAKLYQQAGGKPQPVVKSDAPRGSAAAVDGPLDAKAYGRAVADLYAKLGNKMQDSQEYASLVARRRAYRG